MPGQASDKGRIRLFQPPPLYGLPNPSPFCMKLEAWLRLAKIDYEVVPTSDPSKGPKCKVPWIEDDGDRMGDSTLIIQHLTKKHGFDLDADLTPEQKALSRAIEVMVEERLYWVLVYSRWIEPDNWAVIRALFFKPVPAPIRGIVAWLAQSRVQRTLYGQGLLRHSRDEIYTFGIGDVAAIAALLGDRPYMIDDRVRLVDITVVSALAGIAVPDEMPSPLRDAIRADPRLMDYIARVNAACGW